MKYGCEPSSRVGVSREGFRDTEVSLKCFNSGKLSKRSLSKQKEVIHRACGGALVGRLCRYVSGLHSTNAPTRALSVGVSLSRLA